MKNLLSILAFISLFGCAKQVRAQYVTIPDANFRTFLQQQYPACFNAQGKMDTTCTAIVQANTMNCDSLGIASLEGIQFFPNLSTLRCYHNNLAAINTPLPLGLGTLDCSDNQLTSVSFAQNLPYLQMLICTNNRLTSISLQNLDYFSNLTCSFNQITTLNLQGLPAISTINCNNNAFSTLDVHTLTNLFTLWCEQNQLTTLNVQGLSRLNNLQCYDNQLSTLNLQGTNIGFLLCQNNNLSSIDLQYSPNLHFLTCSNNPIACLPTLPNDLVALIVDNTNITCLPNRPANLGNLSPTTLPLCIPNTCFPALCDGSGTDCVFPGDTNHDGVCNNFDVLPISVLDGQVGVARTNANTNWYGQPSANWNVPIPNTVFDAKFADANGGNTIDSMDINVVYTNYSRTNNGRIPTNRVLNSTNAAFPINIVFPRDTFNLNLSDTITADIFVGNSTLNASNFYGFAASITYDSMLFRPLSIQYNTASFMGTEQQVNVFGINNAPAQKYDIAIARRTRTNATGQGRVARIKGVIAENVAGKNAQARSSIALSLGLTNVLAINNQNQTLLVTSTGDQCQLSGATVATEYKTEFLDKNISVFPNPATQNGVLQINSKNCAIQSFELSDILGKSLLSQKSNSANNSSIFTENLSAGIYLLRIQTDKGSCTKKIVIQ